jgi:hypothetical protein
MKRKREADLAASCQKNGRKLQYSVIYDETDLV